LELPDAERVAILEKVVARMEMIIDTETGYFIAALESCEIEGSMKAAVGRFLHREFNSPAALKGIIETAVVEQKRMANKA
jgi:hypothetical protein